MLLTRGFFPPKQSQAQEEGFHLGQREEGFKMNSLKDANQTFKFHKQHGCGRISKVSLIESYCGVSRGVLGRGPLKW